MLNIIRNIEIYNPEYLGKKDLLFAFGKIEGLYNNLDLNSKDININEIDGTGKILLPGFIDSHVHILGGGGEGGFATRTPEITFKELSEAGITTVVGCLGTDGIGRSMKGLVAKSKALREEGLNCYVYTGSYHIPVSTLTSDIQSDLMMIDNIIGTGEIAISDNRSSNPSFNEFVRCISDTRVAGLLSKKAGICNVHVGDGKGKLDLLFKTIDETDIPFENILPTHINRNRTLFYEGLKYVKAGGYIDLTTSADINNFTDEEILASDALEIYLKKGMPIENITFSSDGNGSIPSFNEDGTLLEVGRCSVFSLYEEVIKCVKNKKFKLQDVIKVITSNVADRLKLEFKGYIKQGYDADFVIVNKETLEIDNVFCKGAKIR